MRCVTGTGGDFFKAKDPEALGAWNRTHLGLDVEAWGGGVFRWGDDNGTGQGTTIWSPVRDDATGFAPSTAAFMINGRVELWQPPPGR